MKRAVFVILAFGFFTANLLAQGTVTFSAGANKLKYTTDGVTISPIPISNPATVPGLGQFTLDFMAAPLGTPLTTFPDGVPDFTSAWAETPEANLRIFPFAGGFGGLNVTLPASAGTPSEPVELAIVAWTGPATTWDDAISGDATSIAWSGSPLSTGALDWDQMTGNNMVPGITKTGADGFNGLVLTPIPDTSPTFLLGGLSAAGLILFRAATNRRKEEQLVK
jgi:hypothetical protein